MEDCSCEEWLKWLDYKEEKLSPDPKTLATHPKATPPQDSAVEQQQQPVATTITPSKAQVGNLPTADTESAPEENPNVLKGNASSATGSIQYYNDDNNNVKKRKRIEFEVAEVQIGRTHGLYHQQGHNVTIAIPEVTNGWIDSSLTVELLHVHGDQKTPIETTTKNPVKLEEGNTINLKQFVTSHPMHHISELLTMAYKGNVGDLPNKFMLRVGIDALNLELCSNTFQFASKTKKEEGKEKVVVHEYWKFKKMKRS